MSALLAWMTGGVVLELGVWIFVRGTALVLVAWALARMATGRGASLRHVAWGGLLAGLLILPAASALVPDRKFVAGVIPAELWEAPAAPLRTAAEPVLMDARGLRSPLAPAPFQAESEATSVAGERAEGPALPWVALLLLAWGIGAGILLARLIGRLVALRITGRRSPPWRHDAAHQVASEVAKDLGIRRAVSLVAVEAAPAPACWGILRPTVGLPKAAASWDRDRLRAVLLHELAHVRRWDYVTYLAGEIACALYWPNPAVLWAARRARAEAETACDEIVLRHGTRRRAYAEVLLEAAREALPRRLRPGPVMTMASGSALRDRVRGVLRFRGLEQASRALLVRTGVVGLAGALAVVAFGLGSDRDARRAHALVGVSAPEAEVRAGSARTLGELADVRALSAVVRLLGDESAEVRATAATAAVDVGSRMATVPLMRLLDDEDARVREAVILALGRTRDRRAFYELEELTGSTDARIRLAATWAIGEIKCVPAIKRLSDLVVRSADPDTRLVAVRGLRGTSGYLPDRALREARNDPDDRVRAAAAESLSLRS